MSQFCTRFPGLIFGLLLALVMMVGAGCRQETSPSRSQDQKTLAGNQEVSENQSKDLASPRGKKENPFSFKNCNIVFVSFDALQARHVGCLGYERDVTPTIDAMARSGFNFKKATSVSSWTVPSSMTWFTGVYPSEHRMVNKYAVYDPPEMRLADIRNLSPELITLADILKANGYATGGFTGNAGVSGGFGYEKGFDEYYYVKGNFGRLDESIPRALAWLKKHRNEKFFLFLHGYDVHGQSTPPDGYDYRFVDKDYDKRYSGSELEQEILREEGLEKGQLTMRNEDVRFWRAIYDEKIQRADAKFGMFLDEFSKLGLDEETVFVLTSDHGTEVYEHRRFDHGFTLYQELIHVPLVFKLPGENFEMRIDERVSSVDIMPTILELLGIEQSKNVQRQLRGKSLLPAMRGEPVKRDVISETNYREYTYKRSIIADDHWKLIYTLELRTRELFNLKNDPNETTNLVDLHPDKARELEVKLFRHFISIGHDLKARQWPMGLNPVYPSQAK